MKTYKGPEIIKAAKYLAKLYDDRAVIEKDFTLDSVDVADRNAVLHYVGTVEQTAATLDVVVYNAKTYANQYSANVGKEHFGDTEYKKIYLWLHSITRLDTEEAKTGKLQLLPNQWKVVHKDFMDRFYKDFNIKKDDHRYPESFAEFNYLGHGAGKDIDKEFGLILLEYDSALKDFKRSTDDYQFNVDIGISNDTTKLALGYFEKSYTPLLNAAFKAVLPMATPGSCSIIPYTRGYSGYHCVEGTYEEILEICKGMKERLFAYYDDMIKRLGGNPNWRSATTWRESGPVYPSNSEDSVKAKQRLEAKVNAAKNAGIARVARVVKSFYDVDLKTVFENATIDCTGYRFADTVVVKIPYKFPKVRGSKVVLQDRELEVELYRDDYPYSYGEGRYDELTIKYQVPGIYTTMSGEYTDFSDAVAHDGEKLMTLRPSRKKYRVWSKGGAPIPVFQVIKDRIAELEAFVKYKGFRVGKG